MVTQNGLSVFRPLKRPLMPADATIDCVRQGATQQSARYKAPSTRTDMLNVRELRKVGVGERRKSRSALALQHMTYVVDKRFSRRLIQVGIGTCDRRPASPRVRVLFFSCPLLPISPRGANRTRQKI